MSFTSAFYFKNNFGQGALDNFVSIMSEAFRDVKKHRGDWTPKSKEEILPSFMDDGSVVFFTPHYYSVTFYKRLICVERLSRIRLLVDKKYGNNILREIADICARLTAKKVLCIDGYEYVEEIAAQSDFESLEDSILRKCEYGRGTIQELAYYDCDYCMLEVRSDGFSEIA
jgi:hypothetical protein